MKFQSPNQQTDDSLLVDISDALSERDRVRFTVHTRTKLPQFSKPVLSVVRQHEEFIWLHDCLVENDQYAGYIIPPPPPKPDFDSSRDKLQRLGDCEASLSKDEFAKMKQELEAEYLAIFKKTVAMHEIFLQRLASHEKFREDNNFKIFLEYENELAVRGKSKREKIAGSISNISRSVTDFVITTSQVVNSNSISSLTGSASSSTLSNYHSNHNNNISYTPAANMAAQANNKNTEPSSTTNNNINNNNNNAPNNSLVSQSAQPNSNNDDDTPIDDQYFEKERLFLALYYNSIKETAICADKVAQAHKCVADSYLNLAQQFVKLASIQVAPVTAETVKSISLSNSVVGPLPSLTLPSLPPASADKNGGGGSNDKNGAPSSGTTPEPGDDDISWPTTSTSASSTTNTNNHRGNTINRSLGFYNDKKQGDISSSSGSNRDNQSTGGCVNDHTSEGLKKLLLHVSDYLENAKKIEARLASDEDLKLTDTFLYYKRDTVAAQELLARRLRFMSEYEQATRNLEKARVKGRTAMQYADVIQKQAKENFLSISKLAKQELIDYKKRRVNSFKRAFTDLAELEIKHLRSHSQLIMNCLNICQGLAPENPPPQAQSPQPSAVTQAKSLAPSLPPLSQQQKQSQEPREQPPQQQLLQEPQSQLIPSQEGAGTSE